MATLWGSHMCIICVVWLIPCTSTSSLVNKDKEDMLPAQIPVSVELQKHNDFKNKERFQIDAECLFLISISNLSEGSDRTKFICTILKFIFCSVNYRKYVNEKCLLISRLPDVDHKTTWRRMCDSFSKFREQCPPSIISKPQDSVLQIFSKRLKRYLDKEADMELQQLHNHNRRTVNKGSTVGNVSLNYENIINLIEKHTQNIKSAVTDRIVQDGGNDANLNSGMRSYTLDANNHTGYQSYKFQNKAASLETKSTKFLTMRTYISLHKIKPLLIISNVSTRHTKIVKRDTHNNHADKATLIVDRNMTQEYKNMLKSISIQNSKDPLWALLCVIFISVLLLFGVFYSRMCSRRQRDMVYINVEEHLRSESVLDVIRRKARFLPMFRQTLYHQLSCSEIDADECFSSSDTLSDTANSLESKLSSIEESSEDEFTTLSHRHQVDIEHEFTQLSLRNNAHS